jgi:cysteine desulfurase
MYFTYKRSFGSVQTLPRGLGVALLYLDTAATTRVDPRAAAAVLEYMTEEFGNSGSRTHEWGSRAKRALGSARERMATHLEAKPDEVIFTSGATESNNLAILGLAEHGRTANRRHILANAAEHKAVLEPLEHLASLGFEVELMRPGAGGRFETEDVLAHVRPDTLLVSMMLVNNETGVIQPIADLAQRLQQTPTFLHVDAAQGFAKPIGVSLRDVDLISISGHKIAGPKGIGALVTRRRGWSRVPLSPLMFGGGQERKLRPGTVPVALVMGLAIATDVLIAEGGTWDTAVRSFRQQLLATLNVVPLEINGDPEHCAPHILNVSFLGIDSEALIVALKDVAGVATGSACTSSSYTPSHVLEAMGYSDERVTQAIRLSWWSDTDATELHGLGEVLTSFAS